MRVVTRKTIIDFYTKNAQAKIALEEWDNKVNRAEWDNFSEVKNMFNSVDSVGNKCYVFNIKGNHYRISCNYFICT